jgi:hypothetical protein
MMFDRSRCALVALCVLGCSTDSQSLGNTFGGGHDPTADTESVSEESSADAGETTSEPDGTGGSAADGDDDGPLFDVGVPDGPGDPGTCTLPEHEPCDLTSDDPFHAMGINCPGEFQVQATFNGVSEDQLHVHTGTIGTHVPPTWPVREGEKVTILSSGLASHLLVPTYMSWMVGPNEAVQLPAPIVPNRVSMVETCAANPNLVGTGDCSNTIWDQGSQGEMGAFDLGELRLEFDVPDGVEGFSFDFAFFTTEYPDFYGTGFNDMFLVWLESSSWTGNVSFDEEGNPISLNAAFLDFKDAPHQQCPGCSAPEVQGTAMEGHAATRWLTTSAPLTPGDHVVVQFVIFDLTDAILDSTVVLDNFQWTCIKGPPSTDPAG